MRVKHREHFHEVSLEDDGTMDTVVEIDGKTLRYSEADRHKDGEVKRSWLRESAIEACDDGALSEQETEL